MLRTWLNRIRLRLDEMVENIIRRYFIFGFGK